MEYRMVKCPVCDGRGIIYNETHTTMRLCQCTKELVIVRRMERSGLADSLEKYTFDRFEVKEPWQAKMKDVALDYVKRGADAGLWMWFGGQSGGGKTHLATAIVGELIKTRDVRYAVWPQISNKLKAAAMEPDRYDELLEDLIRPTVLFIDDFFKPQRDRNGIGLSATAIDIRVAFDVLNYRYLNSLPTIISSEWFLSELDAMDEAIASRIFEKCGRYKLNIKRDIKRNHRYAKEELI